MFTIKGTPVPAPSELMHECTPEECIDYGTRNITIGYFFLFFILFPLLIISLTRKRKKLRIILLGIDVFLALLLYFVKTTIFGL
jgi:hypothetical protein